MRFFSIARFISRDPLGEAGGINLYGYVLNDPVRFIDPLGLWVYGGGVNFTFGFGIGIDFSVQLLTDSGNNWGLSFTGGVKAGLWAGAAISPIATLSTAHRLCDYKGPSVSVGADAMVAGANVSVGHGQSDIDLRDLAGGNSYGQGAPPFPVSVSLSGPFGILGAIGAYGEGQGTGVYQFYNGHYSPESQ